VFFATAVEYRMEAATSVEANSGSSSLSGATAAHRHDGRELLGRRGGGVASYRGHAPLVGANEESGGEAPGWNDGERIDEKTQDRIVENISSFALYGFPESQKLTWKPTGPGLIADLDGMDYTQA
jgi:hypothetical protein